MGKEEVMKLNRNVKARDEILALYFTDQQGWPGHTRQFKGVPASVLKQLIDKKFLDPEEVQNDSPTTAKFLEFIEQHPQNIITVGGYTVPFHRNDYRVTITSIAILDENVPCEVEKDFAWFVQKANVIQREPNLYAWWD